MNTVKCHCMVTIPGMVENVHNSELISRLKTELRTRGIECRFVDTCMGWGCLNQDWLEFECEMEVGYCWPRFVAFKGEKASSIFASNREKLNDYFTDLFHHGKLLIMINYIEEQEDGTTNLIPHC